MGSVDLGDKCNSVTAALTDNNYTRALEIGLALHRWLYNRLHNRLVESSHYNLHYV